MNKRKTLNEILELEVEYISLVESPANGYELIIKSNSGLFNNPVLKTDYSTKTLYGLVYSPNSVDMQGDYASKNVIKKAAYRYMKELKLRNIDTEHSFQPNGSYVAESWIVRENDAFFPNNEGAWAVGIKIENKSLWDKIQTGGIKGISLAGLSKKVERMKDRFERTLKIKKNELKELSMKQNNRNQQNPQNEENYIGFEQIIELLVALTEKIDALSESFNIVQKSINTRASQPYTEDYSKNDRRYSLLGR